MPFLPPNQQRQSTEGLFNTNQQYKSSDCKNPHAVAYTIPANKQLTRNETSDQLPSIPCKQQNEFHLLHSYL